MNPTGTEIDRAFWTLSAVSAKPANFAAPHDMRHRIELLDELPPLPEVARKLLELRDDPDCDADQLARAIELEPAIAAQLIRWANSAMYGFRGKILSVKTAILQVLGFGAVFDLALALAALGILRAPTEGLLGKRFFWRQTLAGSALLQRLAALLPREHRVARDQLHLVYLLHNAGHLLMSHLYPEEFGYLRRLADANPELPLISLERYAWDLEHGQLGAWLMQSWALPEALLVVTRHHHNPYYRGEYESLVWLTCLTDRLLGQLGLGDACGARIDNTPLYRNLQLNPEDAHACLSAVGDLLDDLDRAVAGLV